MAGLKDTLKKAYKQWKRDQLLYKNHRQKKVEGLIGVPSTPYEERMQRILNKPDVRGRRSRKYNI